MNNKKEWSEILHRHHSVQYEPMNEKFPGLDERRSDELDMFQAQNAVRGPNFPKT